MQRVETGFSKQGCSRNRGCGRSSPIHAPASGSNTDIPPADQHTGDGSAPGRRRSSTAAPGAHRKGRKAPHGDARRMAQAATACTQESQRCLHLQSYYYFRRFRRLSQPERRLSHRLAHHGSPAALIPISGANNARPRLQLPSWRCQPPWPPKVLMARVRMVVSSLLDAQGRLTGRARAQAAPTVACVAAAVPSREAAALCTLALCCRPLLRQPPPLRPDDAVHLPLPGAQI